ncbi:DNA-directed RNA polymerase subunit beta [Nocardia yunnanensis]|uniref:DNA-directed RNA polymerase subunit beta n=1 Tax=Nocardia yunnanensis TaxID=2382165 RepID=UPI0013C5382F|nr:DNA-directed RNA polymerase subunit beta [Nocardia yunnanensis]
MLKPGGHLVLKADTAVVGFTMPVELGSLVKAEMSAREIPWGPIVAHVRARRWTFLLESDIRWDTGVSLDAEMMRSNVTVVRTGGEIALPSPAPSSIQRGWVVEPHDSHLPSAASVLEVTRHCASLLDQHHRFQPTAGQIPASDVIEPVVPHQPEAVQRQGDSSCSR